MPSQRRRRGPRRSGMPADVIHGRIKRAVAQADRRCKRLRFVGRVGEALGRGAGEKRLLLRRDQPTRPGCGELLDRLAGVLIQAPSPLAGQQLVFRPSPKVRRIVDRRPALQRCRFDGSFTVALAPCLLEGCGRIVAGLEGLFGVVVGFRLLFFFLLRMGRRFGKDQQDLVRRSRRTRRPGGCGRLLLAAVPEQRRLHRASRLSDAPCRHPVADVIDKLVEFDQPVAVAIGGAAEALFHKTRKGRLPGRVVDRRVFQRPGRRQHPQA